VCSAHHCAASLIVPTIHKDNDLRVNLVASVCFWQGIGGRDISPRGYELVAYGITDNFNYPEKQWDLFSKPYSAGPWIAENSSRGLTPNERDRDATTAKH
jgi:hypothetical protein